jgi:hypothetical protein
MDLKNVPKCLRKRNGAPNGNKVIIKWNSEANESFEKLRETLCSNFVLALPDFTKTMILTTDASDKGYGAVLEQEFITDGISALKPLEYYSRCYTGAQKNYSTTEKELLAVVMAVEHFHTYLYGRKFIIYTDHLPNTLLLNKTNPHPRVERWMMRLQLYEFEMIYKPGIQNILADFLSRPQENENQLESESDYLDQLVAQIETMDKTSTIAYQLAMNEMYSQMEMYDQVTIINHETEYVGSELNEELNQMNIRDNKELEADNIEIQVISSQPNSNIKDNYTSYNDEQLKDEDIQWVKMLILKHGEKKPQINEFNNKTQRGLYREYNNLRIIDNILYRTKEDTNGFNRTQFVLPKQITTKVIEQIHSSIYNAHLGRKKTVAKITERMYRPFLKNDIINVVKTCDTCQKIKRDFSKKLAEMLIITPIQSNQLITTDIGGPLKETKRGNKYFIVIIDHFTKFIQIHPMKNIKAEDVAHVLVDKWMMIFGIPETLLSDGGTQYRSILLEAVYE